LLSRNQLKNIIHRPAITWTNLFLLCLAVDVDRPKPVADVRVIAIEAGLAASKTKNASKYLSASKARGLAVNTPDGWELTDAGKEYLRHTFELEPAKPTAEVAKELRGHLAKIKDRQIRSFVEEAVGCLESKFYRAAVVLSWVGAVSVLQEYIVNNRLDDFNIEADRRFSARSWKWKKAKTRDDLGQMKESEFLDVLETLSIIGKSVKGELKKRLDLRNSLGHPSSLKIGESTVAYHIEVLILNVFSAYEA
jgi:hypothetical protein